MRLPFFNSLLAGAIPVAFDPKLLLVLPFQDHIHWEDLLVQIHPDSVIAHKTLVTDSLKVKTVLRILTKAQMHIAQPEMADKVTLSQFANLSED